MSDRINCLKCIHYYSTWDQSRPRGCKVYGFKSQMIPSLLVKQESGKRCMSYKERPSKDAKPKGIDLNDDSLW